MLPKSIHKERIEQNADVYDFELSEEDVKILDHLNDNFVSGEFICDMVVSYFFFMLGVTKAASLTFHFLMTSRLGSNRVQVNAAKRVPLARTT